MRLRSNRTLLPALMAAALMAGLGTAEAQTGGPVAAVTGGSVQGALLPAKGGAVFKGVPFAASTAGENRWREPQPVKPWSGVRPALDFAPSCAQANSNWNKVSADRGSEDCLYLNVWSPDWPSKAKKPVMVWIHGGGNSGGSAMGFAANEPPFDGASLARKGVVVVSLQYRLGVLGFMGHPELTAESPHHASGGYGLLDQVAALQWVHDNIAKFGGDPANVTVFGQSAGAQDTSLLVASPLTRGLISKAIAESGSPMISDRKLLRPTETAELGAIMAATLKAPAADQVKYLRSLSAADLFAALPEFRKAIAEKGLNLDVGMDGYALPASPAELYRTGGQAHIPMIIGANARDAPGFRPAATPEAQTAAVAQRLKAIYGAYPDLLQKAEAAYAAEPAPTGYTAYGPVDQQVAVDYAFRCTDAAMARWHSAVAPTWHYEFTAGDAAHPPVHSAELDFVFGYLRDQASVPARVQLSEQMQTYWANFAKTGDPNGAGLPRWAKYDAKARSYVEFGDAGVVAKADLRAAACPLYFEKLNRDLAPRLARN